MHFVSACNLSFVCSGVSTWIGWIGYNDKIQEETWVWYDGSPGEYKVKKVRLFRLHSSCLWKIEPVNSVKHDHTLSPAISLARNELHFQLHSLTGSPMIQMEAQMQTVLLWLQMGSGILSFVTGLTECFHTSVSKVLTKLSYCSSCKYVLSLILPRQWLKFCFSLPKKLINCTIAFCLGQFYWVKLQRHTRVHWHCATFGWFQPLLCVFLKSKHKCLCPSTWSPNNIDTNNWVSQLHLFVLTKHHCFSQAVLMVTQMVVVVATNLFSLHPRELMLRLPVRLMVQI